MRNKLFNIIFIKSVHLNLTHLLLFKWVRELPGWRRFTFLARKFFSESEFRDRVGQNLKNFRIELNYVFFCEAYTTKLIFSSIIIRVKLPICPAPFQILVVAPIIISQFTIFNFNFAVPLLCSPDTYMNGDILGKIIHRHE